METSLHFANIFFLSLQPWSQPCRVRGAVVRLLPSVIDGEIRRFVGGADGPPDR